MKNTRNEIIRVSEDMSGTKDFKVSNDEGFNLILLISPYLTSIINHASLQENVYYLKAVVINGSSTRVIIHSIFCGFNAFVTLS